MPAFSPNLHICQNACHRNPPVRQMEELSLGQSLLTQLEHSASVDSPPSPLASSSGVSTDGEDLRAHWQHFNLREQSEILQCLVLFYASSSEKVGMTELRRLWKIANAQKFGKKSKQISDQTGQYPSVLLPWPWFETLPES